MRLPSDLILFKSLEDTMTELLFILEPVPQLLGFFANIRLTSKISTVLLNHFYSQHIKFFFSKSLFLLKILYLL